MEKPGAKEEGPIFDLFWGLLTKLATIGDDGRQLYLQTGLRFGPNGSLALLLELDKIGPNVADAIKAISESSGLEIPPAYGEDDSRTKYVTAHLKLDRFKSFEEVIKHLRKIPNNPIKRYCIPSPYAPCRESQLGDGVLDIGMPPDRVFNNLKLDGTGVIVGIIDDGCAFAKKNFLTSVGTGNSATCKSRVRFLWDQTLKNRTAPWTQATGFYGYELSEKAISAEINSYAQAHAGKVDEDEIYAKLDYQIEEPASHGTHVMDIAAGNDDSLMGAEGVARNADIIFVQLPTDLIEQGGRTLFDKILDGVLYIFARAKAEGKPAVVNISYGAYGGPHDGTSFHEKGIDGLLRNVSSRAVVVAAGNGFEANCHTTQEIKRNKDGETIRWNLPPDDPTLNLVDIWYNGDAELELYLTCPGEPRLGPFKLSESVKDVVVRNGKTVGWVLQENDVAGNHDNHVVIALLPTDEGWTAQYASAPPAGTWKIEFHNSGRTKARLDAWIERDAGKPGAHRRQSRFDVKNANPECTLSNLAACELAISVGAYNTDTQEVARYSACGPTRPIGGDLSTIRHRKPEVCAPASEVATGTGILSASSHRAQPTRMNGTSAAAPYVSGLVALMLQVAQQKNKTLTPAEIRDYVIDGSKKGESLRKSPLKPSSHQVAEDGTDRPIKQTDVWGDLTGAGRINILESIKLI